MADWDSDTEMLHECARTTPYLSFRSYDVARAAAVAARYKMLAVANWDLILRDYGIGTTYALRHKAIKNVYIMPFVIASGEHLFGAANYYVESRDPPVSVGRPIAHPKTTVKVHTTLHASPQTAYEELADRVWGVTQGLTQTADQFRQVTDLRINHTE